MPQATTKGGANYPVVEAFVSNAWFGAWHKHRYNAADTAASTATQLLPQAAHRLSYRRSDRWLCEANSVFRLPLRSQPDFCRLSPCRRGEDEGEGFPAGASSGLKSSLTLPLSLTHSFALTGAGASVSPARREKGEATRPTDNRVTPPSAISYNSVKERGSHGALRSQLLS